jgi:hypothetical protein
MELSIVKYKDLKNNNCSVIAVSDNDETYRIEKIYRNNKHDEMFFPGKLLEIFDNKLYHKGSVLGEIEKIDVPSNILELIKTQIILEREIKTKQTQLNHIDHLLLNNHEFTDKVY